VKQLSSALRKSLVEFVAASIVVGVTVLICEVGFRTLLFSQVAFMERFREPGLYADYFSEDDWWKFYYAFNKQAGERHRQAATSTVGLGRRILQRDVPAY